MPTSVTTDPGPQTTLDGAWWPESRELAARASEAATQVGNTTTPTDVLLAAAAAPIAQS